MRGVPEKLLKGMTVSLVNSGLGSQFVPMGRQRWWYPPKYLPGAHYTAHFKGEGGFSWRWPGGNAFMEDWGHSGAVMLDGKSYTLC